MNTSVFVDNKIGIGQLTILNDTHIYYEHIRSETKEVVDQFYLQKNNITPTLGHSFTLLE